MAPAVAGWGVELAACRQNPCQSDYCLRPGPLWAGTRAGVAAIESDKAGRFFIHQRSTANLPETLPFTGALKTTDAPKGVAVLLRGQSPTARTASTSRLMASRS